MPTARLSCQALVIGSGIAGLTCALELADAGFDVVVLTAGEEPDDGNTAYAQGGIVYTSPNDSPSLLEKDIRKAGWDHNYIKAVRFLARQGPAAVKDILIDRVGIPFARKTGGPELQDGEAEFDLTREGGHSVFRVLHCADYTGRAIMDGLIKTVQASTSIRLLCGRTAVDLITSHHHTCALQFRYQRVNECLGAYVYNNATGVVETILADFTVLATGGIGRIFQHTTNADCCVGSAITMASRAGASLMNVEYMQFHPTALYHRSKRRFLITEAMRGEGAILVNSAGERFMTRYDKRLELAPRDIVSRAIVEELHRSDEECVFLDCRTVPHDLPTRFPTIYKQCLEHGISIMKEPIPVVPAAHYHCGGVLVDLAGRTSLERLYAVGECSCTGVHGANRLASTSLLEGLLWGHTAGEHIAQQLHRRKHAEKLLLASIRDWQHPGGRHDEDPALIAQDWATIRNTMWNYAGLMRTEMRLKRAADDLNSLVLHLVEFYKRTPLSKPLIDLWHGSCAASIVAMSALRNKESKGCHYVEASA
ncbi:L-aspartate oxidase [Megalodesulfovibrio gigas]|uniref:L-aspartate oxidase n=1 Tax=Megalodesulfovibrio gigas (strain ATCC 19364 / DSM 1382 / NCIMB 9332 / VKM B-1759) TaxID=1121448 RepID=T2G9S7_MEGG1|nr:L-aspartate oxidase [Megalodesulfovibrio gigas]AGW12934.1 putative L-aspartate oxidase [Megalodesulfovibrio gigas DSM 1382 = ATCC 19364]